MSLPLVSFTVCHFLPVQLECSIPIAFKVLLVRKVRKGDRWKRWEDNSKTDPNISELHFGDWCAGNCIGKVESILREGYELFRQPNENADHETMS
jgi:hypothetical protein